MRITCDIIADLMPIYIENICSEDSRKLLEEHINQCEKCSKELEDMRYPINCPALKTETQSKDPFLKIRKKVRIKIVLSIIITCFLMIVAMFSIQEVGVLHDYFYPMDGAVINNEIEQKDWIEVCVGEDKFLNYSSIFYNKEVVNDANSSGDVIIRILDEKGNIVLDAIKVKAGESINLKSLKNNKNYTVEAKCKEGIFFLNFV